MSKHHLSVRKTFGYVGTYAHLDQWEEIGVAHILSHKKRVHRHEDGPDTYTVQEVMTVQLCRDADKSQIKQAIRDTFSREGCSHEYDCCGCWNIHVSDIRKRLDGSYIVYIGAYQNY